ncbi:MAG: hypothetical protein KIT17_00875 [Rubrivivax sp.]|nr:hypothetical protein [Rubrivivax sp.]
MSPARRYDGAMADPTARAIVSRCLSLRLSHPRAPAIDTLDLVMLGHHGQRLDFGADAIPPATFALVVAEALDRGMIVQDWRALTGPQADPAIRAGLQQLWRDEVWPKFVSRYQLS